MCVLRAVTQASLVLYTPAGIIRSYTVIDSVALDPFRSKLDIKIEFLESLDCFAMFVEPFWLILAPTGPMVQFQRMSPIEMHKLCSIQTVQSKVCQALGFPDLCLKAKVPCWHHCTELGLGLPSLFASTKASREWPCTQLKTCSVPLNSPLCPDSSLFLGLAW